MIQRRFVSIETYLYIIGMHSGFHNSCIKWFKKKKNICFPWNKVNGSECERAHVSVLSKNSVNYNHYFLPFVFLSRNQWILGSGYPVALQTSVTVSPSLTTIGAWATLPMILGGTAIRKHYIKAYKSHWYTGSAGN